MKRIKKYCFFLLLFPLLACTAPYKDFVILIASYNNEQYAEQNIISAFQNYPEEHYRIIFIDDCSQDNTLEIVRQTIERFQKNNLVAIISNNERKGALHNHYHAIHTHVNDTEIVVNLDGDDQLASPHVLTMLNNVYSLDDIWLTYGQFKNTSNGQIGFNCPMPDHVVTHNTFRQWRHIPSHLRTFYAKLYKNIKQEDLALEGNFFEMCADMATMIPMIEQAGNHFKFIPIPLYLYNDQNPISDHIKSRSLQRDLDCYIRSLPTYTPLMSLF